MIKKALRLLVLMNIGLNLLTLFTLPFIQFLLMAPIVGTMVVGVVYLNIWLDLSDRYEEWIYNKTLMLITFIMWSLSIDFLIPSILTVAILEVIFYVEEFFKK